jgi:hypothetical protein
MSTHYFTNISELPAYCPTTSHVRVGGSASAADKEIFEKTLAFYIALCERGCSASDNSTDGLTEGAESVMDHLDDMDVNDDSDGVTADQYLDAAPSNSSDVASDFVDCLPSSRRVKKAKCGGKLVMQLDAYNQPFIR